MLVKLQGVLVYENEIGRKECEPPSFGAAELCGRSVLYEQHLLHEASWCLIFFPRSVKD